MKEVKKCIIISDNLEGYKDDFVRDMRSGNYYYNKEDNKYSFRFRIIKTLKNANKKIRNNVDIIILDYGLVGGVENVQIIENLFKKCIYFILQSALPSNYIIEDIEKLEHIKDLFKGCPVINYGIEETLIGLYSLLRDNS